MKRTRRMLSFVLALVLCLAMGITAFAAGQDDQTAAEPDYSITVEDAKEGETYKAFKMLDLSVDDPTNPTAFRYTVNSDWAAFAQTAEFKAIFTVDDQGYVTTTQHDQPAWNGESNFSKLVDAAAKYAADHNLTPAGSVTIAEGAETGTIELEGPGYYVVSSTLGTRAMVESTPSTAAVKIKEKNEEDSIEKTVKEDSNQDYGDENDAQIGDTIEFKSKVTIAARSINVVIHDTMDAGLTLNADSIKLYTDESLSTPYSDATIKTGTDAADGDTFTIEIPDTFAATAISSQQLYVVYTAELNKNAVSAGDSGVAIVDQINTTKVTFGDNTSSTEDTTTTTTHKFEINKFSSTVNPLADAVFELKKNGTVVNLMKIDANNYRVVDDIETGTASTHAAGNDKVNEIDPGTIVSDIVTVSSGNIVIWGVDTDSDYTLEEIQAPKGYNEIAGPIPVEVKEDNSSKVEAENNTGAELPSTGGMGTTIFYVVGSILVIGATVLLIAKRRMNNR